MQRECMQPLKADEQPGPGYYSYVPRKASFLQKGKVEYEVVFPFGSPIPRFRSELKCNTKLQEEKESVKV